MRFSGKNVVVSGGASGLGKATATRFARDGAKNVYLFDIDEKGGAAAAEELRQYGSVAFVKCDVSDEASVKAAYETVINDCGSVDILHSNAGIIAKPKFISDMSFDEWNRMISINLNGMFLMAKYAVTQMLRQAGGVIVFTGSNWAYVCDPGFSSYAASKGGVVSFARALALDHAKDNIRINVVCPGNIHSPLLDKQLSEEPDPAAALAAMGQVSTPEEIANLVTFLASEEASAMKGSAVIIDQGETLGYGKGLSSRK
jgi:NAD(P)-dependent dehydrogenase (short-subunit alcohol dehydrogenase family)